MPLWAGEGRAPAFSRGRSGRKRARPATAPGNSFPPARTRAFAARSKRAAGRRPALRCGPDGHPMRQVAWGPLGDQMLEALPIGVLLFPGSGISENLADKARKMGIPVKRFVPKDGAA